MDSRLGIQDASPDGIHDERWAAAAAMDFVHETELLLDVTVPATIDLLLSTIDILPDLVPRGHKVQPGLQDAFSPGVEDARDGVGDGSRAVVPGAEERGAVADAPDGAVAGDAVRG
eukprot:1941841-Prymnesium_polylepis.1